MGDIENQLSELGNRAYNLGIIDAGRSLDLWILRRNSLIYKIEFLKISQGYISRSLQECRNELSSINPSEEKKVYDVCVKASKNLTYHLECFIYQLLSSLDNLKSIVPFFYKDLSLNTPTMRKLYASIKNQKRLKETNIGKFIDNEKNKWLITEKKEEGLYGYRAQIYHWLSNLCGAQASLSLPTESFTYNLEIVLPDKICEITGYTKEIDIDDFVKRLIKDYEEYVSGLLESIKKDMKI